MQKELEEFGLSEKEAKVYLASLAIGKATAEQLAKQAGIKRPTAYVQIGSLSKMGLMSTFEEEKKTYFAPESPEGLKRIITKRKEEIESREKELGVMLPDLLQAFEGAGERPVVRFFQGKEGIIAMREEVLKVKTKEILVMYSHDELAKHFNSEERNDYSQRRIDMKIHARMVYNSSGGSFKTSRELSVQKYIDEKRLCINNDIVIFDDKVAITSFKNELSGILLTGTEFASSLRSMFEFVWVTLQ